MTNYGNQSVYESLQKYFVKVCTLEGEGKTMTCAGTACIRTASSRKTPLKGASSAQKISAAALSGKFRLGQKFAANAAGLRQGKQLADALVAAGWVERDLIRQSRLGILP
ncbi:hypothetical protein [Agrobacterium salinitolerans]|uniref:hypothetical protein n=1 Tax=Agrobacterium salinitolerans TaxID=1183413 RepID=UPI0022C15C1D|nr:hypothetical protein [Agrobacterium salinitolerans]